MLESDADAHAPCAPHACSGELSPLSPRRSQLSGSAGAEGGPGEGGAGGEEAAEPAWPQPTPEEEWAVNGTCHPCWTCPGSGGLRIRGKKYLQVRCAALCFERSCAGGEEGQLHTISPPRNLRKSRPCRVAHTRDIPWTPDSLRRTRRRFLLRCPCLTSTRRSFLMWTSRSGTWRAICPPSSELK